MDIIKYGLGALPSEYDPRDFCVRITKAIAFEDDFELPDIEIYNQGSIGNCVMQAISAVIHNHYYFKLSAIVGSSAAKAAMKKLFGVEVAPTQTNTEFGRTFGYGHWRDDGYYGQGMHPNTACNGLARDGIPPRAIDSRFYDVPEAISYANENLAKMLKASTPFKGWTWARLYTVEEIKATIRQGVRCVVCLPYVEISNNRWYVNGKNIGYHEMMIMGWHKVTGFRVRNSWGKASDGGSLAGSKDGYVNVAFEDIFACNDVIALFPPVSNEDKLEEEIAVVRTTLRLKSPYMRDKGTRTGNDVTYCQQRLTAHNFPCGTIDGVFGSKCDSAARAFQKAQGLVSDGIVGAKTWAKLDENPKPPTTLDVDAIESLMKMMVGDYYVIGGQGHEITEAYLNSRKTSKPAYFTKGRYEWLVSQLMLAKSLNRKIYCEDCSGLLMKVNEVLHFFEDADLTANSIWKKCTPIYLGDVQPGDVLFKVKKNDEGVEEATHMAWVGKEGIYEAAGTAYGVVFRADINDRDTFNHVTGEVDTLDPWTHAGRIT